jgi:small subunit ribosomal protein S2
MQDKILKRLLQAKAHKGTKEVDPAMFSYIRGFRNESSIFDLSQTLQCCRRMFQSFNVLSKKRHHLLFLNTRPELNDFTLFITKNFRHSAVVDQWTGGILTNWKQIKKTVIFFSPTTRGRVNSPIIDQFQEVCDSFPRLRKSRRLFQYLRKEQRPNLLVVLDPNNNEYAIHEAYNLKLPVIAFVDADTPSTILKKITYPIPSNNRSIMFMHWVLNSMMLICNKNRLMRAKAAQRKKQMEERRKKESSLPFFQRPKSPRLTPPPIWRAKDRAHAPRKKSAEKECRRGEGGANE